MNQAMTSSRQLGAELRNWRKTRALTQAQAAERIGIAQKAVCALETRTGSCSIERLMQLLSALDLELVLRDKQADADGQPRAEW